MAGLGALFLLAPAAAAQTAPVTPQGWRITPAGQEVTIPIGPGLDGPWGLALSPDGRHALTVSSGNASRFETTELWDVGSLARTTVVAYDGSQGESVFYGGTFSPGGDQAFVSGAGQGVVHTYRVDGGTLRPTGDIPAGYWPAGLAFGHTPRGNRLYVANNLGGPQLSVGPYEDPAGHTVTVIDPATRSIEATVDLGAGTYPLDVVLSSDGRKAYVTEWMGRSVAVVDTATERAIGHIVLSPPTDPLQADHPSAIAANPRRDELYTANANSDTVSVIDTANDALSATIQVGLVPRGPKGSTPEGLAVSPDGRRLFVALSGENAVAVVDLDARRVLGFIPTSWYPSGVKVTPDGRTLLVSNVQGQGAGPNPCGPMSPLAASECQGLGEQYVGSMIKGTLQRVPLDGLGSRLARWTHEVRRNNQADGRARTKPAALDAIKHVIYVIKENRTYDQVFGSLGRGNGDPRLTIFGDESAPNHRELARRFGILDNFYVDAEVSADGHPWSVQATATDYVDKTWPFDYAAAYSRQYNSEFVPLDQQLASEPLAGSPGLPRPPAAATVGYLWDNAWNHGVSYRDYGEATPWSSGVPCQPTDNHSDLTHLQDRFSHPVDPSYVGWNMGCPDHTDRYQEWAREFGGFERSGQLPGLEIVYFPNDHTVGTSPGAPTPASYVADNDLALGKLVDRVSHSRFWRSTAIVVLEDDAQDGPDHVDAHRSPVLVISPWTQTGRVDSTHYDTASALATIEDLLGLSPMSIFDQRATRMWPAFADRPTLRPYTAIQPTVVPFGDPGSPVNPATAPLAAASAAMDFSRPDHITENVLSQAVWKSVRGAGSPMPAPRHTLLTSPAGPSGD